MSKTEMKKIIEILNKEKIQKIKRMFFEELRDFLDDYFYQDLINHFIPLINKNNCSKCKYMNNGRSYWICKKDHNIHSDAISKEFVPFTKTRAMNDCLDYKLKEIKEVE